MAQAYYLNGDSWKKWSADMVNALPYSVTTDPNLDNCKATGLHTVNSSSLTSGGGGNTFRWLFLNDSFQF